MKTDIFKFVIAEHYLPYFAKVNIEEMSKKEISAAKAFEKRITKRIKLAFGNRLMDMSWEVSERTQFAVCVISSQFYAVTDITLVCISTSRRL